MSCLCLATSASEPLHLAAWTVLPFIALLLAIALLPLTASHFWHSNRNKAFVAGLLALPVAAYLMALGPSTDYRSTMALGHAAAEYASFIILLASLYTVSGGIVLRGDIEARPAINTAFLAAGAVLANFIGTTGASMLLIRPVLATNRQRQHTSHLPVFFIFVVSNLGGLLTPLGDPPLFLGFLRGVEFFWTLSLWPQWLLVNGLILAIFFVWDTLAYRRETPETLQRDVQEIQRLRLLGRINFLFLGGILAAVLLQSEKFGRGLGSWLGGVDLTLHKPWGEILMLLMAVLSLAATPKPLRHINHFSWGAIVEVAVLFAGIFVTMVPALELLSLNGRSAHLTQPWQYFWLTGLLSSFLDNAPTYLTFATLAAGADGLASLATAQPALLQAISCGAVFMGANTYIGNGPNFMVKSIAEHAGYRMPSFFGYMAFSGLILLPVFGLVTLLFFW